MHVLVRGHCGQISIDGGLVDGDVSVVMLRRPMPVEMAFINRMGICICIGRGRTKRRRCICKTHPSAIYFQRGRPTCMFTKTPRTHLPSRPSQQGHRRRSAKACKGSLSWARGNGLTWTKAVFVPIDGQSIGGLHDSRLVDAIAIWVVRDGMALIDVYGYRGVKGDIYASRHAQPTQSQQRTSQ